jgi:hypothetical protein
MSEQVAVMLSDSKSGETVAEDLARRQFRIECYRRLDDLFREHAPATIPVLIFHQRERPKGRVLEVIGRLTVEHPAVQVVVVTEAPLSLEVTEYLAGHGVVVVRREADGVGGEDLPAVVTRMHERRQRSLAA